LRRFLLTDRMDDRRSAAVQLVALTAFIAAVIFIVMASLQFVAGECVRGKPFLPAIFPCFEGQ
jgi:hypothetical protein